MPQWRKIKKPFEEQLVENAIRLSWVVLFLVIIMACSGILSLGSRISKSDRLIVWLPRVGETSC